MTIPIYKAEQDIARQIQSNASVVYASPITLCDEEFICSRVVAALGKKFDVSNDLYLVKSILVTTNWNLNDDVFTKEPVWASRHTPINKPTNIGHQEDVQVGHIIDTWAINDDNELISNDVVLDDLPGLFHICTASVIYKRWEKQENRDRVEKLIAEIENGTKYVSMECVFSGFDYAVMDDSNFYVVARQEETAFLTKHLRAYGGTGEVDGKRVGRLLKNIVFSGKGYVDKPANPNSIILDSNISFNTARIVYKNPFSNKSGVYLSEQFIAANKDINIEENCSMSTSPENALLKEQLDEVKATLKTVTEAKAEVERRLAEADVAKFETTIKEMKVEIAELKSKNEKSENELSTSKNTIDEMKTKFEEISESKKELETKLAKVEAENQKALRVALLVDGKIEKKKAESHVEKFANLTDEQFEVLAQELISVAKSLSDKPENKKSEDKKSEKKKSEGEELKNESDEEKEDDTADEKILEGVETKEEIGSAADESSEDDTEEIRKSMASYFAKAFLHTGNTDSED